MAKTGQGTTQHRGVHNPEAPMLEGSWQGAHDAKSIGLPTGQPRGVRAHHQVELHGAVTEPLGFLEGMLAEARADAPASCGLCHHITSVGHMGPESEGIGLEVVAPQKGPLSSPACTPSLCWTSTATATTTTWLSSTHW